MTESVVSVLNAPFNDEITVGSSGAVWVGTRARSGACRAKRKRALFAASRESGRSDNVHGLTLLI